MNAARPLSLALVGYGRMGREIERVALSRGHRIVAVIHPGAPADGSRSITIDSLDGAEAAMEFTKPEASAGNIEALLRAGCRRLVVGTTGWKQKLPEVEKLVGDWQAGLVHADNFSLGMALFYRLVEKGAEMLVPSGYDPYVLEWHHAGKRDAPSGTARRLAGLIERAAPGRRPHEGDVSKGLPAGSFHVASVRAGAIPGAHLVGFESEGESLELWHRARSRAGFALGAVLAAEWLEGRKGVFTFDDVLSGAFGETG